MTGRHLFEQGVAREKAGDIPGAFDAFRGSAKADPKVAAPWVGLARLLSRNHQRGEAIACLERAAGCEPDNAAIWTILGRSFADDGQLDKARQAYDAALAKEPDAVGPLLSLGALHEDLGDREQASAAYRRLLSSHPGHVEALSGLLNVGEGASLADALDEARLRLTTADDREAALLGYAIGKALTRAGEADGAFAALAAANAARRRQAGGFDRAAFDRRIKALAGLFSRDFLAERRGWGHPSERPVFIVGLPRSGTTLTEQVLAGHPEVHGAGELDLLTDLATGLPDRLGRADPPWPEAVRDLTREGCAGIAHDLLVRLDLIAPAVAARVIDKQPLNFWHLGLVALAVPNACIINCTRDIRDCGLSIFSENFTPEQRWATDLGDIAHYWGGYRRLMDHWRAAADLKILDVRYEDLVTDLEGQSRRLLDFMGLDWTPSVLAFHAQERAVQTPSRWQVRQPIYHTSNGRWQAYERHIGPLIAAAEACDD